MASDIADAIARAQRDVEAAGASDHDVETDHVFYSCMEGSYYCDGCMAKEALPALGPASVALAAKAQALLGGWLLCDCGAKERAAPLADAKDALHWWACLINAPEAGALRQALQDWADAQQGG